MHIPASQPLDVAVLNPHIIITRPVEKAAELHPMPSLDDVDWEMDDPSAPSYFGSHLPSLTPIEHLKDGLDTMLEGKQYTKYPEWYKDFFQIHWDSDEIEKPDWRMLMSKVGNKEDGNLIGYTLGTLCEIEGDMFNSFIESFGETNQNRYPDGGPKGYMKNWILAVAPVLYL